MTTIGTYHVRGQSRTALLAVGKLLWLLEIMRPAATGAGIALPALGNGHCLITSRDPSIQWKPQILNDLAKAVNGGQAAKTANGNSQIPRDGMGYTPIVIFCEGFQKDCMTYICS
jgi:hypothetical protein